MPPYVNPVVPYCPVFLLFSFSFFFPVDFHLYFCLCFPTVGIISLFYAFNKFPFFLFNHRKFAALFFFCPVVFICRVFTSAIVFWRWDRPSPQTKKEFLTNKILYTHRSYFISSPPLFLYICIYIPPLQMAVSWENHVGSPSIIKDIKKILYHSSVSYTCRENKRQEKRHKRDEEKNKRKFFCFFKSHCVKEELYARSSSKSQHEQTGLDRQFTFLKGGLNELLPDAYLKKILLFLNGDNTRPAYVFCLVF